MAERISHQPPAIMVMSDLELQDHELQDHGLPDQCLQGHGLQDHELPDQCLQGHGLHLVLSDTGTCPSADRQLGA